VDRDDKHRAGFAARITAILIVLAIVVGLVALEVGNSTGEGESSALDAEIPSVRSILDSYEADRRQAADDALGCITCLQARKGKGPLVKLPGPVYLSATSYC